MKFKVLVFPEEKGVNPYQELLYEELAKRPDIEIKYFNTKFMGKSILGIFNLPILPKLFWYRLTGYKVFHLHWTFPLKFPWDNFIFRTIDLFYQLIFLSLIKLLNYKIVWTVHEILPHGRETSNDRLVRKILAKFADVKIVHSKTTIKDMKKIKMDTKNTLVIPYGSYVGVYENKASKAKARNRLRFSKKDFIFLFFGVIEKRKGIKELLESFAKVKKRNIKLLIAGKVPNTTDNTIKKLLIKAKKEVGEHLSIFPNFIKEKDIQYYFNCSDIVVLPFTRITTSSSAILALSFAKPLICPKTGNLKDLPKNVGFFYNPKNKNGLLQCMKSAIANKAELNKLGHNAFKYVQKNLTWQEIAAKTYQVYKKASQ